MAVFKSPGVFVKEVDVDITSTPKGTTNFPQIW